MEAPIEIFNNTHIEVTRIVKIDGEYYMNKHYFYIADIRNIEASRYGLDKSKCTKIWLEQPLATHLLFHNQSIQYNVFPLLNCFDCFEPKPCPLRIICF